MAAGVIYSKFRDLGIKPLSHIDFHPKVLINQYKITRKWGGPCPSIGPGSRSAAAVPASTPELLIIASSNPSKVAELQAMLAPVQLRVQQQPKGIDIEETGSTYLENARLKAAEVARLTGHWTLADDSGIAVDALGSDNVPCVMLPSKYTSQESLEDAKLCAKVYVCMHVCLCVCMCVVNMYVCMYVFFPHFSNE